MSAPTLRPYQLDSLEALAKHYAKGQNRLLVKKPTGTGKTVTFAELLKYPAIAGAFPPSKGAQLLVIAHREELLDQAADKIQKANRGKMVSIEQGDRHANRFSDVVIASIQTLAAMKFRRLLNLLRWHSFPIVVIDEAHHAAAATYRTALVHLGFLPPADASDSSEIEAAAFDDVAVMEAALAGWDQVAPKDRLLVGVTATPNRSDAIGLGCVFQTIAYSYALKDAIDDGYLVPITSWVIETATNLDAVRMSHGDFNQKDLAAAVNNEQRNKLALAAWREHADGLPSIAFTVDVAHAYELAKTFEADGVRARAISGETPREDRRQILRAFQEGQLDVVSNCMVLTEGTDLPLARCIIQAKPTKSATLYEQMIGRGLRPYPEKPDCIVLDLVDVSRRHSLQTAPILYGLPPGIKAHGEDLRQIERDVEELLARAPGFDVEAALRDGSLTLEQLHAKATRFNVWAIQPLPPDVAGLVSMNWIRTGESYRISYSWADGHETLEVKRDLLGAYELVATLRSVLPGTRGKLQATTRQRTLAHNLPTAADALQAAEQYVALERRSVSRLKDREAPWRSRPASEKQVGMLRRLGVPFNPKNLTMGAASDLIDVAYARRGAGKR